ncbi:hypothetical protein SP19_102 [Salmonella phage 19]|nr:hypothetical protein SP19_102 [Salmonella phage 19]
MLKALMSNLLKAIFVGLVLPTRSESISLQSQAQFQVEATDADCNAGARKVATRFLVGSGTESFTLVS